VIFMVTAPMIQQGTIDIPSACSGTPPPQAEAIFIEIAADGALALRPGTSAQPQALRNEQLAPALQEALAANPEQPFLVAADSSLNYQKVIDVLEVARTAGVRKISLITQSTSPQQ
jgi:biopolymer transport protein TolR